MALIENGVYFSTFYLFYDTLQNGVWASFLAVTGLMVREYLCVDFVLLENMFLLSFVLFWYSYLVVSASFDLFACLLVVRC